MKQEELLPVFHTVTPYKQDDREENDRLLFLFGGKIQKPPTTQQKPSKKKKEILNIFSNDLFNEDIFYIILSFVHPLDLLNLQLVSKQLRICQLTEEDYLWKKYFEERVQKMKNNTTGKGYGIMIEVHNITTPICNFKKALIKAAQIYNPPTVSFPYTSYATIKSMQTENTTIALDQTLKTVVVGDGATGKSFQTLDSLMFVRENVFTAQNGK